MSSRPESKMRQRLLKALRPLHGIAIENSIDEGTPDVNYIGGWIECKCVPIWPARPTTIVRVDHFTPLQRLWIEKRSICSGMTHVMLVVAAREWILLPGYWASRYLGNVTRSDLIDNCVKHWQGGLVDDELLEILQR